MPSTNHALMPGLESVHFLTNTLLNTYTASLLKNLHFPIQPTSNDYWVSRETFFKTRILDFSPSYGARAVKLW